VPERQGLEDYATALGLDLPRFRAALDGAKFEPQIKSDLGELTATARQKDGGKKASYGTPLFFINGRPLVGNQPVEKFVALIDEELAAQDH
jgi:protein-disulfide isomerase